jgi:transcriptional regulator
MYIPRQFANQNEEELLTFIDSQAVATVITSGPGGLMAAEVPLLRQPEAKRLWGHLARPNPQLEEMATAGEVLVVFNGPSAYVSPNYYESPGLVPTWNFVTVQVRGRVVVHDDREVVRDIVHRLSHKHETGFEEPWTMDKVEPDKLEKMLGVIVGFHIEMDEIRGKFKLSQNRNEEDRAGVIAGLEAAGQQQLAALMREQQ